MGLVVDCFGLRFGVRTNAPEVWPRIVERLPAASEPAEAGRAQFVYSIWVGPNSLRRGVKAMHLVYRNSARVSRSGEIEDILSELEVDLLAVAARASPHFTFLPAAGVCIGDQAILVVCPSAPEEDRLVEELVRRGGLLCARDYSPIDAEGRLLSSVARGRTVAAGDREVPFSPLPVAVVALAERVQNEEVIRLERLGPAFAAVELARLVTSLAGAPGDRLAALTALTRRAAVVRVRHRDSAATSAELIGLLAASSAST